MKKLLTAFSALALLLTVAVNAHATIPWGAISVQSPSAGAATCTTFATDPVCILNLTGNLTTGGGGLTVSGGTVGTYATLIWMQDGTGSRTVVFPTNITNVGGAALPAIPSAANAYTVWVLQVTATNTYVLQAAYDNMPMAGVFSTTQTSAGTAVAPVTAQAQATIVAPGTALTNSCSCVPQAQPSAGAADAFACIPETNAIQCLILNASAATNTPSATAVNVRLLP